MGQVGIFDATNSTRERRKWLIRTVKEKKENISVLGGLKRTASFSRARAKKEAGEEERAMSHPLVCL